MVSIIHPAMLYFAYINDPIYLRKKVNLHHQPLKLTGLNAGNYPHKTPSRDNFLICLYHKTLIFLDCPTNMSRNLRRRKVSARRQVCANAPLIVWRKYMFMAAVRNYLVCICLLCAGCQRLAFWIRPDVMEGTH